MNENLKYPLGVSYYVCKKFKQKVKFCCLLYAPFIIIIFSIIFLFSISNPLHVMAQIFMLDNSSNLLTITIQDVSVMHKLEGESNFEHLGLDYKGPSSIIPIGINKITTSLYYQNMSSQDYTIDYQSGSGTGSYYIPKLGKDCHISTKSIEPQKAEELRKKIADAKFFDQPYDQTKDAKDAPIFTIRIQEEDGMKRDNTVKGWLFTAEPALQNLIKYVKLLCEEIPE